MPVPGEIPAAKPIVTETLLMKGVDADVKDLAIDEMRERDYVRGLNASDRASLIKTIADLEKTKGTDASLANVRTLLGSLKADIDKPYYPDGSMQPQLGSGYLDWAGAKTVEKTIGDGGVNAVEGLMKLPEYGRDELKRIANAETSAERIGIIGKNVGLLAAVGGALYGLNYWANRMIDGDSKDEPTWKGTIAHLLKWTGLLALTGWGANWLLDKSARPTEGPVAGGPAEMKEMPTGPDLITADVTLKIEGKDVRLAREWAWGRAMMLIKVDGKKYQLGLDALETTLAGALEIYEGKDHYVTGSGHRFRKTELARIVKALDGTPNVTVPDVPIETYDNTAKRYSPGKRTLAFTLLP